jgi:hypothetical protein
MHKKDMIRETLALLNAFLEFCVGDIASYDKSTAQGQSSPDRIPIKYNYFCFILCEGVMVNKTYPLNCFLISLIGLLRSIFTTVSLK